MRILIVDDDRLSLRVLQALVVQAGHEAVCANDGEESWQRFSEGGFSLVICDWEMPRLSGIDLCKRIRAHPARAYTYVIMVSSRSDSEDVAIGVEAGADDFLSKPVRRGDLLTRLRVASRIVELQHRLGEQFRQVELANARFHRDLAAAQKAQQGLLPTRLPVAEGLAFAWRVVPCDELAGDTLNIVRLDARHLAFHVLDVSGHGVASALLAVQVSRYLNPSLGGPIALAGAGTPMSPLDVALELNRVFPADPRTHQFFTLLYGVYDTATHQVRLVCAGHPPPLVQRADGRVEAPEASGHPIGLFAAGIARFGELTIDLEPGDRLWAFSDGVTETSDAQDRIFDTAQLAALLPRLASADLDTALASVLDTLGHWRQGRPVADDISLMAVERLVG